MKTVGDVVAELLKLPQDYPALLNWEGQLVDVRDVEVVDVKQYGQEGSRWVDYYPELELDEGEVRSKAVLID